jgi:hypothetical protein
MVYYSNAQLSSFPWIVSCDTLRSEDLLVKFWGVAAQLGANLSPILPTLERLVGEESNAEDWGEDAAAAALEALTDTLQDLAPSGFYFGASEGDGACFGYWLGEDWAAALETIGLDGDDPTGWAELIARLEADGLEADRIEDAYAGRAEGYSEDRAGADYALDLAQDTWLPELPSGLGWAQWPISCIDWSHAWRELQLGDGYRLHDIGGGDWLVFRSF